MADDEIIDAEPIGPRPRPEDNPYAIAPPVDGWNPKRFDLGIATRYLEHQPEQGEWPWHDHCEGLAGGILAALHEQGREVVAAMGQATWEWDDELNGHVPVCRRCGDGPLRDHEIADGYCVVHAP